MKWSFPIRESGNILGQSISEHIDRRMGETDHPELLLREEVEDRV